MTAGLDTKTGARTYTLDDLVQLAWSGRVRVPHFQRGFRWTKADIIQLVDSIHRGYPVGNLLLWERPADAGSVQLGALTIRAPHAERALWVVDGQQRVTSLANVLHPDASSDPRFALGFDVRQELVVPLENEEDAFVVPLPVIFDLTQVLTWFADRPEAAEGREAAFTFERRLGVQADLADVGRTVIASVVDHYSLIDDLLSANTALLADVLSSINDRARTLLQP